MTWNFAKELPTLGRPYNAIPEPTLVEGLSPTQSYPRNWGIAIELVEDKKEMS